MSVEETYLQLHLTNNDVAWLQSRTGVSYEQAEERIKEISELVGSVYHELLFKQAIADLEGTGGEEC